MTEPARIDWVDYAKGISIILVVMMHSTLSTEEALGQTGWLHEAVMFARPFRMPAFFLISGLFLARTIDRDWRTFLDRKVLHFVYFYVLWLTIQFVFRAPGYAASEGMLGVARMYFTAFVEPFGTLWFIYLLPVFFLTARLTRGLPWMLVLLVAAALEIAPIQTQWTVIDEFASRFVYFYAGYVFGSAILAKADRLRSHSFAAIAGLAAWGALNLWCVKAGTAELPVVSLILGCAGSAALVAFSVLLARSGIAQALRYCGENSIVIYLAHFLPMGVTRILLVKTQVISDPGTAAAVVTAAAIVGPLILYVLVRGSRLNFLFERPARLHLNNRQRLKLQPAE